MTQIPPIPPLLSDGTLEERQEAGQARRRWRAKRDEEARGKIRVLKLNIRRLSMFEVFGLIAIIEKRCPELLRPDKDSGACLDSDAAILAFDSSQRPPVPRSGTPEEVEEAFKARQRWRAEREAWQAKRLLADRTSGDADG